MAEVKNQCAGLGGALYHAYIERPWLARRVGRILWGTRVGSLYSSIDDVVGGLRDGQTVLDVPCGGGIALRALDRTRDVRFVCADIAPLMLDRVRARAAASGLHRVETVEADMKALPFPDEFADVVLSYSGLHMIDHPERAVSELARCLAPGGRLTGSTFTSDGSRRQNALFAREARRGYAPPPASAADLAGWLRASGLTEVKVERAGFALFSAAKPG